MENSWIQIFWTLPNGFYSGAPAFPFMKHGENPLCCGFPQIPISPSLDPPGCTPTQGFPWGPPGPQFSELTRSQLHTAAQFPDYPTSTGCCRPRGLLRRLRSPLAAAGTGLGLLLRPPAFSGYDYIPERSQSGGPAWALMYTVTS